VGGDYYDFERAGSELYLALGDVSGKGTGAALLMTVLRAAVRGHWDEEDLGLAVERINRTVAQNTPSNKYITFFMARLDPETGHLGFVNAGHNPPLLVRADGSSEELSTGGMVLGLFEDISYECGAVDLGAGDVLVIFSDGITETWSPTGEEFGEEGALRVILQHRREGAEEIEAAVQHALEEFTEGAGATDDRTLIVLKRHEAPTA
jgi:sigma-B regulation protein RsbU (phosphoserine phosphatase)